MLSLTVKKFKPEGMKMDAEQESRSHTQESLNDFTLKSGPEMNTDLRPPPRMQMLPKTRRCLYRKS